MGSGFFLSRPATFTLDTSLMGRSTTRVVKNSSVVMSMLESGRMEEAQDRAATNSHLVESTRAKFGTVNLTVSGS